MRPLALVTGGIRRLGAHLAAALINAGHDVATASHSDDAPDPVLAAAVAAAPGTHWHHVVDLTGGDTAGALIAEVSALAGRVPDVLVNAAARFGQDDVATVTRATLDAEFALNLFAPVLLTRALVDASGAGTCPAIVHVVDSRVRNPNRDQLSYTLSKQALAASIRTLAIGLRARARVNGVAPGLILSNPGFDPGRMDRVAAAMPLGRTASPADVADAMLYLIRATSVTGQMIAVDGGAHLESYVRDFSYF